MRFEISAEDNELNVRPRVNNYIRGGVPPGQAGSAPKKHCNTLVLDTLWDTWDTLDTWDTQDTWIPTTIIICFLI